MSRKNEMMVKEIQFDGDDLVAAQDVNQQIWVGVTWVMKALGFNEEKTKREKRSMREDRVLNESIKKINFGSYSNGHEVVCLPLKMLPLWIAKISVTPSMKRAQPDIADKIYRYQVEAADVLAKAFLPETDISESETATAVAPRERCATVSVDVPYIDYSDKLNNLQSQIDQMTDILTNELEKINENLIKAMNVYFTEDSLSDDDISKAKAEKGRTHSQGSRRNTEHTDPSGYALWRKSLENRVIRCIKYNIFDSCHAIFDDIRHQIGCDDVNMVNIYEDPATRSLFEDKLDQIIYNESVRDRFCQMDEVVADAYARKGGKITQAWVWHTAYMHMSDVDWEQEIEDFCNAYDRDAVNKKELVAYSRALFDKFCDAAESI